MSSAALSLQQAIFASLTADAALTALLGGPRIYDGAPQGSAFPYLTFGQSTARDWSTATDDGKEHIFTIHVWSRTRGTSEAQAIMDAVRAALHDQPLTLDGHRLVNLRAEFSDSRRDPDGQTMHGMVRFRAVTEPA
ncbi:MAG TPA: DUF3168 domain-containing protein [Hyphomicrobiaceae bacterium]|jgi:hypothetical protein|nr:DUF3168 domain-containing protein [Hyphomicrobiaceae bacterium]